MSVRILGVELPVKKRVMISLRSIYGIGPTASANICAALNIDDGLRVKDMSEELVSSVADYINANYTVEGNLRREISANINRLMSINCRRGRRLRDRLPVHGQRSKSNARTAKGKAGSTSIKKRKK